MHLLKASLVIAGLVNVTAVSTAIAQRYVDPINAIPRADVSLGFEHINANAPPGGCKCFGLNGGTASATLHLNQWLAVEGEFTGSHANDISSLGQNLTLMTYTVGPKVSFHRHKIDPYGEALFGSAHGSDSYFPSAKSYSSTASSFAFSAGGGADVNLSSRYAIRAIDVQYLKTGLPNGANDSQNHLMVSAGIVVKFRGRGDPEREASAPVMPTRIYFNCNARNTDVTQGQVLEVLSKAKAEPGRGELTYAWSSNAGTIQGSGQRVTINTAELAPGDYEVSGHAVLAGNDDVNADCEVPFRVLESVKAKVEPVAAPLPPPPPPAVPADEAERVFHTNVPDALFDYDKWAIRSDARQAIDQAAMYLNLHPAIRVLVGGYSDERGTVDYNIALGLKRATATRDSLVGLGVAADRIQIVSYGKGAQVCVARDEACYQQNRRAAFSLHP